ncbi:hypothetical protein QYS48_34310 [Marivirga arenosa]|uniref:Uncharacterized protein n=1 Tax=Marivirga arenosa TaxID=3059076 RepID=A0AA51N6M6_9BACT|nr:hypothetical protein [Marivirga sp. ABR2-2]WMN06929.1 hypothetical protein QYS48_34310 [Marivirga sp. ABR2-2]
MNYYGNLALKLNAILATEKEEDLPWYSFKNFNNCFCIVFSLCCYVKEIEDPYRTEANDLLSIELSIKF